MVYTHQLLLKHLVIDYTYLHQINSALSETDLSWDLSFVAVLQFTTQYTSSQAHGLQGLYSVKVRVDSEHVIDTLLERKEFTVARQYAKIVGAPQDQISVKEVGSRHCSFFILIVLVTDWLPSLGSTSPGYHERQ